MPHASIPVFSRSELQTEIALLTCEAEHIALSTAMREVTPLIKSLEDLSFACDVITAPPLVAGKAFEDNQSCKVVAESKNPPARAKHHHFRSLVLIRKLLPSVMLTQRSSWQTC